MQHSMSRSITRTSCSVRLPAFAILQALPTQRSLVYCALICSREWHAIILELDDRRNGFLSHVVDCVLVAEPVGTLDCVVHVPAPIVLCHIAERGVDATLRGDRM